MSNNLPGNPFEQIASEHKSPAHATLALAFELRTQTLLQANLHNRREAARIHGANFEDMPEDIREMISEQGAQIDERLGGAL